jgi:hypothetical protein
MSRYQLALTVYVLFLHFLADFVFQTDSIAKRKSKEWSALAEHIYVYTLIIFGGLFIQQVILNEFHPDFVPDCFVWSAKWAAINGAVHFCVDAVTSRINARLWAQGRVHAFFVGVGADQFIHAATLILTLWWGVAS